MVITAFISNLRKVFISRLKTIRFRKRNDAPDPSEAHTLKIELSRGHVIMVKEAIRTNGIDDWKLPAAKTVLINDAQ
jgi:hypothetical protein